MRHEAHGRISPLALPGRGVHLEAMKPGEDEGIVFRFRETQGRETQGRLEHRDSACAFSLTPYALKTLKKTDGQWRETNLLEE